MLVHARKKWSNGPWWSKLIQGISPFEFWKKNLFLTRNQFFDLTKDLQPYISPILLSPNHRALNTDKKLALTLYYLKDTGSLIMTAHNFGVAINTASSVIYEVYLVICQNLGPQYIRLPKTREEMKEKVSEFEAKFGIIQAFGCIDGTHVPIKCPLENSQDYFCYKQYYSLNVQAVCDYKGMFMDVECRWPGRVHDSKVFANSSINEMLRNEQIPATFQTVIHSCKKVPNYLIGDPAYTLTPFFMKEFDNCNSDEEVIFNSMLRSARNQIKCSFGRLNARWAILTRNMNLKLEILPTIFMLTLFCTITVKKNKFYIDEEVVKSQIEIFKKNEESYKNVSDFIFHLIVVRTQ